MQKLKALLNNIWQKDKKLSNVIIIFIVGVIVLIVGSLFLDGDKKYVKKEQQLPQNTKDQKNEIYETELEKKIENILSKIDDVGSVSVMVTLLSDSERIPAVDRRQNETVSEDRENGGGGRKTVQNDSEEKVILFNEQGGKQQALVLKEIKPKVKGVIVAAKGAKNPRIKADITLAVSTLCDIPVHKVQVFVKKD